MAHLQGIRSQIQRIQSKSPGLILSPIIGRKECSQAQRDQFTSPRMILLLIIRRKECSHSSIRMPNLSCAVWPRTRRQEVHKGQRRKYPCTPLLTGIHSRDLLRAVRPCNTWVAALRNLNSKRLMDQEMQHRVRLPLVLRIKHLLQVQMFKAQSSPGTTITQVTRCHLPSVFGITVQVKTQCTLTQLLELVSNTKHLRVTGSPTSRWPCKGKRCRSLRRLRREVRLIGEW